MAHRAVSLPGRRRVSPVPTTTLPPFHVPYAAGFFGAAFPSASPLPWPSPHRARLGSRLLPCGHTLTTRQTSLDAAGWWVAPSLKKARPHASTPGSLRTPVGCYRGVLAPPPAGLSPASRSGHQDAPRWMYASHRYQEDAHASDHGHHPARRDRPVGPRPLPVPGLEGATLRLPLGCQADPQNRSVAQGRRNQVDLDPASPRAGP